MEYFMSKENIVFQRVGLTELIPADEGAPRTEITIPIIIADTQADETAEIKTIKVGEKHE